MPVLSDVDVASVLSVRYASSQTLAVRHVRGGRLHPRRRRPGGRAGAPGMPGPRRAPWGDQGRAWLPGFGETAERRWADAQPIAGLITAIALGAADQLTGRILHPGDDLSALTGQCQSQPGRRRRRLRLDLG